MLSKSRRTRFFAIVTRSFHRDFLSRLSHPPSRKQQHHHRDRPQEKKQAAVSTDARELGAKFLWHAGEKKDCVQKTKMVVLEQEHGELHLAGPGMLRMTVQSASHAVLPDLPSGSNARSSLTSFSCLVSAQVTDISLKHDGS